MRNKSAAILFLVLIITIIGGFFIYPNQTGSDFRPWRLGLDLVGGAHLVYEIDMAAIQFDDRDSVAEGLRDVIERRVNFFGVSEPTVVTAKSDERYRIIVDLAGIKDTSAAIQEIGETPFLQFAEVQEIQGDDTATTTDDQVAFLPTELTGRYVQSAQVVFDQTTTRPYISLELDEEGAAFFETITERNIGRPLAIFLDGELITAPTVSEKISGGRAQITGDFTVPEARTLVQRFNAGALPAPIALVNQETVGASLGADSLQQMIRSGFWGTIIVMIFMILYYRTRGVFASFALAIYVILTLAIFKLFGVTMTLAGIAGFILSIGMAVDANILIFERSKEEEKKGASRESAVIDGFKRAWPAIRDSNVTTILTTIMLYYFSTGFVRGFALTLMLGVIISMFSAITVTRLMLQVFTRNKTPAISK